MTRFVAFVFCLQVVQVVAQPQLLVTPDTLFVHETTEFPFTITNVGTEKLRLDSLYFRNVGGWGFATLGRLETDQTNYYFFQWFNPDGDDYWREWSPDWTVDGLELLPGSMMEFYIEGFDPCPICRDPEAYMPVDFFWNGSVLPYTRTLGFNVPVSVEPDASQSSQSLEGPFPNPSHGEATFTLNIQHSGTFTLVVQDVLGRGVHREELHDRAVGPHSIPIHLQNLAPGIYFVRIVSGDVRDLLATVRRMVILP